MERRLIDEKGYYHIYDNTQILGEGGQGKVYKTRNPRILIKLMQDNNNEIESSIKRIKALDISENCKVAKPILKLNIESPNISGYIMQMMDGMVPISNLMDSSNLNLLEYYKKTGGIKRRLLILKKIASILSELHSKNIVYGDLSDNNIFISNDIKNSEVWFIDCDNMAYSQDIKGVVFTKYYGAPEIENKKSKNTIETDIYAFAVLAFRLLTLSEPFGGSILNKNEEEDWDDDWDNEESNIEAQICKGKISWVGEKDVENKPIYGLSKKMDELFNYELKKRFEQTFGINGRSNPKERPKMKEWYLTLLNSYNEVLRCGDCNNFFYYKSKCPFCHSVKKEYLEIKIVNILKVENIIKEYNAKKLVCDFSLEEPIIIEKRMIKACKFNVENVEGIILKKRNNKYLIENKLKQEIIIKEFLENKFKKNILQKRVLEVNNFDNIVIDILQKDSIQGKRIKIKKVCN